MKATAAWDINGGGGWYACIVTPDNRTVWRGNTYGGFHGRAGDITHAIKEAEARLQSMHAKDRVSA